MMWQFGDNLICADDVVVFVCVYYKNTLPLHVLDIHILQECINVEIKIEKKLCNFIVLYCSPSQSQDTFESFIDNLE